MSTRALRSQLLYFVDDPASAGEDAWRYHGTAFSGSRMDTSARPVRPRRCCRNCRRA